jgi:hypothetical protein
LPYPRLRAVSFTVVAPERIVLDPTVNGDHVVG